VFLKFSVFTSYNVVFLHSVNRELLATAMVSFLRCFMCFIISLFKEDAVSLA
jgi:hypothetical protein